MAKQNNESSTSFLHFGIFSCPWSQYQSVSSYKNRGSLSFKRNISRIISKLIKRYIKNLGKHSSGTSTEPTSCWTFDAFAQFILPKVSVALLTRPLIRAQSDPSLQVVPAAPTGPLGRPPEVPPRPYRPNPWLLRHLETAPSHPVGSGSVSGGEHLHAGGRGGCKGVHRGNQWGHWGVQALQDRRRERVLGGHKRG